MNITEHPQLDTLSKETHKKNELHTDPTMFEDVRAPKTVVDSRPKTTTVVTAENSNLNLRPQQSSSPRQL